jgi:hypothetical protein
MAFNVIKNYTSGKNILASEVGLVLRTVTAERSASYVTTRDDGVKIIPKGTVFPANNATAKGLVFEDVIITDDAKRPMSIIVAGRILEANLPATVADAAKTPLNASGIVFE